MRRMHLMAGHLTLVLLAVLAQPAGAQPEQSTNTSRILLPGVPFISVGEAARLDYPQLATQSLYLRATEMMSLRYHQPQARGWDDYQAATDGAKGSFMVKADRANGVGDLRQFLLRGHPVVVLTARTPYAHDLYGLFDAMSSTIEPSEKAARDMLRQLRASPLARSLHRLRREERVDELDHASGLLGKMVSLDFQRKIGQVLALKPPMNPLHENAVAAARVVVGVDDVRKLVIMHDAAFGPAWEVPFDEFEIMWAAAERWYSVLSPKEGLRVDRTSAPGYPARTSDQRAAQEYFYAYSLAAIGRRDEAEKQYRAILARPELSRGYRYLVLLDAAYLSQRKRQHEEAVSLLRQAAEQIPQAPVPWVMMAEICKETGVAGGGEAAAAHKKKADSLWKDQVGLREGLKAFPDLPSRYPLISLVPGPPR